MWGYKKTMICLILNDFKDIKSIKGEMRWLFLDSISCHVTCTRRTDIVSRYFEYFDTIPPHLAFIADWNRSKKLLNETILKFWVTSQICIWLLLPLVFDFLFHRFWKPLPFTNFCLMTSTIGVLKISMLMTFTIILWWPL